MPENCLSTKWRGLSTKLVPLPTKWRELPADLAPLPAEQEDISQTPIPRKPKKPDPTLTKAESGAKKLFSQPAEQQVDLLFH